MPKTAIPSTIGGRIRQVRVKRGQSQMDFAADLDCHPNLVCKWESGRHEPRLDTLAKIAKLGGVTVGWLINGEG